MSRRIEGSFFAVVIEHDWQGQSTTGDRAEVGMCCAACGVDPAGPEHVSQVLAAWMLVFGGVASVFKSIIS